MESMGREASPDDLLERDRWGRPMIVPPGGGGKIAYTRCTTFVKALEGDQSALALWKQRMTALGLSARPDLLMAVATAGDGSTPESKKALNKIVEQAAEAAAASGAATIGTALHKFTERLDKGLDLGMVPAQFVADLAAYQKVTQVLKAVQVEQFGVYDPLQVGGTWDRLNEYQGKLYIGDVKTGRVDDLSIGKIAMQLSIYAHCDVYDPRTDTRRPQPDVDKERAIIIGLPAGTGTAQLYWVDIKAGWKAVQIAAPARRWSGWANMKHLAEPIMPEILANGAAADFIESRAEAIIGQEPAPDPAQDMAAYALQQQQVAAAKAEAQATMAADAQVLNPFGVSDLDPAASAGLLNSIRAAASVGELSVLWEQTGQQWTAEHKAAASWRKNELTS
jgi:hypothetical protein